MEWAGSRMMLNVDMDREMVLDFSRIVVSLTSVHPGRRYGDGGGLYSRYLEITSTTD